MSHAIAFTFGPWLCMSLFSPSHRVHSIESCLKVPQFSPAPPWAIPQQSAHHHQPYYIGVGGIGGRPSPTQAVGIGLSGLSA